MRKLYSILLLLLALHFAAMAQQTEIKVSVSTGTCLRNGTEAGTNAGLYFRTWNSTATDPSLSITTPANDMWIDTDGERIHFYGTKTFTLTAQTGYIITGYSFDYEGYTGSNNSGTRTAVDVTPSAGTTVTGSATEKSHVVVSNVNARTTTFSASTNNIVADNFIVTLEPTSNVIKPFVPTTIVDGQFASGTRWYTMSVKTTNTQCYYVSDNNISLAARYPLTQTDADLWCFVGNDSVGYKVYNKQTGAGKVLAATASDLCDSGVPSFVDESSLTDSHTARWAFDESATSLSSEPGLVSVYMHPAGSEFALNNFGGNGQLKFWSGRDAGSTFLFQLPPVTEILVDLQNGSLADGTWASTFDTPALHVTGESLAATGNNLTAKTITLTPDEGYKVTGYSFDAIDGVTITPQHGVMTETDGTVSVEINSFEVLGTSFVLSAAAELKNFKVTIEKYVPEDKAHTVTVFDNDASAVPYRIPALAKKANGDLVLVVDYRYCKADIGNGPIDLRYKISTDNGHTWGPEMTNLGDGNDALTGNQWNYAFGDPSIVADAENPNELLVMCVGGHVGYFSSTYENPQHVVRFRSHDGGKTWTEGDSITYQIYNLYKGSIAGDPLGIFLTSGRIMQSRYTKVGDYYRLYIAHPFRGTTGQADYVIYSDDFGETWQVLGHNAKGQRASTGNDESKCEEMPDGSVVISSRVQSGGRVFNVFTYTDRAKGEGQWSTCATPDIMASGMVNACNGEILVLPAKRNSDGQKLYLALQSVPQNSARVNVGFYYKEIASPADYADGTAMAANWKKALQVTQQVSVYSTMVLMDNDSIGFVYEETNTNGGCNIVFKSFTLDSITGGAYSLVPEGVSCKPYLDAKLESVMGDVEVGTAVGQVMNTDALDAAKAEWESKEFPTINEAEAVIEAYNNLPRVQIQPGNLYSLLSKGYYDNEQTVYLAIDKENKVYTASEEGAEPQLFYFEAGDEEGQWYMVPENEQLYTGKFPMSNAKLPLVESKDEASALEVKSETSGWSLLHGLKVSNSSISYVGMRYSGSTAGQVRPATATAGSTTNPYWRIEFQKIADGIANISAAGSSDAAIYDLTGRRVQAAGKGLYIVGGKKVLVK